MFEYVWRILLCRWNRKLWEMFGLYIRLMHVICSYWILEMLKQRWFCRELQVWVFKLIGSHWILSQMGGLTFVFHFYRLYIMAAEYCDNCNSSLISEFCIHESRLLSLFIIMYLLKSAVRMKQEWKFTRSLLGITSPLEHLFQKSCLTR